MYMVSCQCINVRVKVTSGYAIRHDIVTIDTHNTSNNIQCYILYQLMWYVGYALCQACGWYVGINVLLLLGVFNDIITNKD